MLLLGVFLINFSSAGLFDPNSELAFHEEGKNGKYGYYEINDTTFWIFNNKPVKTIELIENDYSVLTAWNIKEIEVFKPTKLFDKTNYLDKDQKKDRKSLISSELHFYREWETKTRLVPSFECLTYETIINGSNSSQVCTEQQDNSYEESYEEWGKWKLYNFQSVQEGLYQTKTIVTRSNQGTGVVDWVDENEGWDLIEWATWWDLDWPFKREIKIQENSASSLTNYSTLIYINYTEDTNSNANANFSDLRFLNSTENGELDYWIENKTDSSFAWVWVEVTALTASINTTIYMYYGNSGASSGSNIKTTFLIGDDFNDGSIDTSLWQVGTGTQGETSGYAYFTGVTDPNWRSNMYSKINFTKPIRMFVNTTETGANGYAKIMAFLNPGGANFDSSGGMGWIYQGASNKLQTYDYPINVWDGTVIASTSINTWTNMETIIYGNNTLTDIYQRGTGYPQATTNWGTSGAIGFGHSNTVNPGTLKVDLVYVREYIDTEPTSVIGVEQISLGVTTTLITPTDALQTTNQEINFTFQSETNQVNLTNATLNIWNATDNNLLISNFTNLTGNETVNTTFINNLTQGNYLWGATTKGTAGTSDTSANRTLTIHTTIPDVTIHNPQPLIDYFLLGDNLTLNWTVEETGENLTTHITNCTYEYNGTLTILNNTICTQTGLSSFEYVLGVNNLTFNVTDILGLVNSTTILWEITLLELNQTYDTPVTEGTPNTIIIDLIIFGDTIDSAILDYGGVNYTTSIDFDSGNYTIGSTVVAPLVANDTNITFKLFLEIGGVPYETSEITQLIQAINFSTCTTGDKLLNIFLFDEEEKTELSGTIEINAMLMSKISGEQIESVLTEVSSVSNLSICLDPISSVNNFYLDADISYSSTDYAKEFYFIRNADLSIIPINLSLFDLNLNSSTEFLIRYQGQDLIKVEGAIVQLQRYYISSGGSETVEAPLTSISGTAIVHIDLNTVKYSAIVVKDGVILDIFEDVVFDCENELSGQCTQNLYADVTPYNVIDGATLKDFSYTISDTGDALVTTFSIPSGSTSAVNIVMTQRDQFGETTSCNKTVTTSSGSLECTYNKTIGDSYLFLEVNKGGESQAEKEYFVPEANGIEWGGLNWLFLFGLLISVALMAISSPEWIVGNAVVVFIIGGALWMADGLNIVAGLGLIIWLIAAAIVLILEMSNKEDR